MDRSRTPAAAATLLVACAIAVGGVPAAALPAEPRSQADAAPPAASPGATTYERLGEWRFSASSTPLPAGGSAFVRGAATWQLESGAVRLQEPVAEGVSTGAVFEGRGVFELEIPEGVERDQLRRFAEPGPDGVLELVFERMVVRTAESADRLLALGSPPDPAGRSYERNELAAERHGHWLEHLSFDADARVLVALATPGSDYLVAAFETDEHGWLLYEHDPRRLEEGRLQHFEDGVQESWVSVDRVEASSPAVSDAFDLRHADVRVDLTEAGRRPARGITGTQPRLGRWTADLTGDILAPDARVLRLSLSGYAEVGEVRVDGEKAFFLRHHIGGRRLALDDELYDESLVVLLPEPRDEGAEVEVSVDYTMEIYNYARGRGWYPGEANRSPDELHTGSIELTLPRKIEARAMGRRVSSSEDGRTHRERWEIDHPTVMLTFAIAERADSYELDVDGAPHVEVFGAGMDKEAKFHNVAADVANSVRFFSDLFRMPLETEELRVASIVGGHGQSFHGFIHMAESSFYLERPGASELFRAHEVAHQWWGHRVSWQTYRDQWLSEAFAEYSAMMYVQATMEGGEHWFGEILDTYNDELTGSIQSFLSKFARPGLTPLNPNERAKMGPIGIGYRARSGVTPGAYFAQVYQKGAIVLHMLRVMLRNLTKSDDLFVRVLGEFLAEHDGGAASTEDFIATLTRVAPGDWGWFFDQWVYGTAIPEYSWGYDVQESRGGDSPYVLRLTVRQSNVPEGFRMPVPVAFDFGRQGSGQAVVLVDKPEETFEIPLPARPKDVQLNPRHAVLAEMDRL